MNQSGACSEVCIFGEQCVACVTQQRDVSHAAA